MLIGDLLKGDRGDEAGLAGHALVVLVNAGHSHALSRVFNHFQVHLMLPSFVLV